MTTPDIELILDRWLGEGTDVLPDRSVEAVLRSVERTSQRAAWRVPWRTPTVNGHPDSPCWQARRSSSCS